MPLEIVRNAVVFHARGLINTRAIQNNLDWVWPYWIERQFDPLDVSFLPRSANISHINLTHRNWTAVALPDVAVYSLVDPRGLVTPLQDGWSIDAWIVPAEGEALVPSQSLDARQTLDPAEHAVTTSTDASSGLRLTSTARMVAEKGEPWLVVTYQAAAPRPAELVVSLRPYNCEGIQFIDTVEDLPARQGWRVNREQTVQFDSVPARLIHSNYAEGDVFHHLASGLPSPAECPVGMTTAAACFPLQSGPDPTKVVLRVPLGGEARRQHGSDWKLTPWHEAREGLAELRLPDARAQFLYESAVNSLLLLSAHRVYPGPYTYRRFWYRDASLMLEAITQLGAIERVRRHLDYFPIGQKPDGYFESQEGEWDSNGLVLWAYGRFIELTGETLPPTWAQAIEKGARWLAAKRKPEGDAAHAGLLPAGFSAEHFGPNDYYYWDDFWAIGGLRTCAAALERGGQSVAAEDCRKLAAAFTASTQRSIDTFAIVRGKGAIPASPYRRMDSGAIGVLAADYPLQLYPVGDDKIAKTYDHFLRFNFVHGGFFQDMTHSGVNIYLTLAIAQSLLRAGDARWQEIVRQVAKVASPTGQWPEAIHPATGGGCIGDGQHGWAAAEWFRWIRNAFVREEHDALICGSGLLPEWLEARQPMRFGPTLTPWGPVTVEFRPGAGKTWETKVSARWRQSAPKVLVELGQPSTRRVVMEGDWVPLPEATGSPR